MSDETSISPFRSTPLDRHGLTEEGREAAAIEADRMFARYAGIPREAFLNCAGLWHKRDRYEAAIAKLREKVLALEDEMNAVVEAERPRALQYLRQAVVWFVQYVRGQKKRPPSSWKFSRGEVRLTKCRTRVEWADDEDILEGLRNADLPFEALEACQRVKVVPDKSFIGKHLEDRDGAQWFVWTDPPTGEIIEREVFFEEPRPGGDFACLPLRRTVEPPVPYKLEVVVNDQTEEVEAPWLALPEHEDEGGETDGDG